MCNNLSLEVKEYVAGILGSLDERDLEDLASSLEKMVEAGRQRRERDLESDAAAK